MEGNTIGGERKGERQSERRTSGRECMRPEKGQGRTREKREIEQNGREREER